MSTTPPTKFPHDPIPWIYWIVFLLIILIGATWILIKPGVQIRLPFLKHEVPAYYVIEPTDVYMGFIDTDVVSTGTILKSQDLIGHYSLAPISPNQPISEGQIGVRPDPRMISNTFAVAITANSATILGGSLRAGDVVSVAAVPLSNTSSLPTIVFDAVLVLDVKSSGNETVVILAIPASRWPDYLAQTHNATVVLARQVK